MTMPEPLHPADTLWCLLGPWSAEDTTLLTADVWLHAHIQTEKMLVIERLESPAGGLRECSEALEKLCQLADAAQCSLLVLTTPAEQSGYACYGFAWLRGNTKDVWVPRPHAHPR
jgi:hypothetical protein